MISPMGGAFEFSQVQIPTLTTTLPGRGVVGHNIDRCISMLCIYTHDAEVQRWQVKEYC